MSEDFADNKDLMIFLQRMIRTNSRLTQCDMAQWIIENVPNQFKQVSHDPDNNKQMTEGIPKQLVTLYKKERYVIH